MKKIQMANNHEKILNFINNQEHANKNHNEILLHTSRLAKLFKSDDP